MKRLRLAALCSALGCTKESSATCPKCHVAAYCSAACQARAWEAHAANCIPRPPPPALLINVTVTGYPYTLRVPYQAHSSVGDLVAVVRGRTPLPAAVLVLQIGAAGEPEPLLAEDDLLCSVLQLQQGGQLPCVRIDAALMQQAAAQPQPQPQHAALSAAAGGGIALPSSPSSGKIVVVFMVEDDQVVVRMNVTSRFASAFRSFLIHKFGSAEVRGTFLLHGTSLSPNSTPEECGMDEFDVIDFFPERPPGDIGIFVSERSSGSPQTAPGAAWLLSSLPPNPPPPPSAVAALADAVLLPSGRPPLSRVHVGTEQVLSATASAELVALVEAAWRAAVQSEQKQHQHQQPQQPQHLQPLPSPPPTSRAAIAASLAAGSTLSDFKLLLRPSNAQRALGPAVCSALAAALGRCSPTGTPPPLPSLTFALRRTEAESCSGGRWIGWHYDQAGLTACIALQGGGAQAPEVVGGQLVYALAEGGLLAPARLAGRVVAHSGDVAHGVTRHESGVRYGLFALVAREEVL